MNAVYNGTFSAGQRDDVPYDLRSPLLPFRHSPWLADGYSDDNRPEKPRPSSYIDSMLRFFHAFPQTNRFKLWSAKGRRFGHCQLYRFDTGPMRLTRPSTLLLTPIDSATVDTYGSCGVTRAMGDCRDYTNTSSLFTVLTLPTRQG